MLILNPTDFHCMDKHSWNIFQNIMFYVPQKKLSEKHSVSSSAVKSINHIQNKSLLT